MVMTWLRYDYCMIMVWLWYDYGNMIMIWSLYDYSMVTIWLWYDYGMITVWLLYDYSMVTIRLWYDYDIMIMMWLWYYYEHKSYYKQKLQIYHDFNIMVQSIALSYVKKLQLTVNLSLISFYDTINMYCKMGIYLLINQKVKLY